MPLPEHSIYMSVRVHRATRLNGREQARLLQRLQLLDKARLRQARLTNQDIRLTTAALDYVLHNSGHSPEGRDPAGENGQDLTRPQLQFFLYGQRVVSRRVHRVARSPSAVERSSGAAGAETKAPPQGCPLGAESTESSSVHRRPLSHCRPHSSPAGGRGTDRDGDLEAGTLTWPVTAATPYCDKRHNLRRSSVSGSSTTSSSPSPSSSSPTSQNVSGRGRLTPRQAWEDDVHEVTLTLLQTQQQQQQQQQQQNQEGRSTSARLHSDGRRARTVKGLVGGGFHKFSSSSACISFPTPRVALPASPVTPTTTPTSFHHNNKLRPKSSSSGKSSVRTEAGSGT
ncbi:uncharacterized protein LOC143298158 [Babylonia areolata]|uniref:uncharacterized protein LOC143298158 n=1 Tax=Babylonia areolata TaxID=304850 RepID=UPI003FCEEC50